LPGKYLDFAYTFFRIDGMFVSFPDIDIGNSSWNIYFGGTSTNMNGNLTLLDSSYEEGHILASPLKNQPTSLMEKLKSWLKLRFRKRL
jgi:hypothetical protein